jgi:pimeloyl-ACP methyl ester carboxylesterase
MSGAGRRLPGAPEPMLEFVGDGGVTLTADEYGSSGPLVLLLHGGGQTRHAWKGAGQDLANAGYHAFSLDARGHGDSGWPADADYSYDALVRDLVEVTRQLGAGAERPILVGASMGGGTSLSAVGHGHIDAAALVLVDTAPRIEAGGVRKIRDFMGQAPDGFETLEEVADAIANYQPQRKRPRNLDGLAKNIRLSDDGRYRWHWDPAFMNRPRPLDDRIEHQESAARNLTCPTLLVRGGMSDVLSEEGAQAFLDIATHAEYANVGGAGHMVAGDRNDIFVGSVLDFLGRTSAA